MVIVLINQLSFYCIITFDIVIHNHVEEQVIFYVILKGVYCNRAANINIQKIGRIQTKNREVFKISCNFNGTKLARNKEVAKFGCQNGQKCWQNREPPY